MPPGCRKGNCHFRQVKGTRLSAYAFLLGSKNARSSPAIATIVRPGHSIRVNGNPNGPPTFVPASVGDNLGLLISPTTVSIPKLTAPIKTEATIAAAHSPGSHGYFKGGSLCQVYNARAASTTKARPLQVTREPRSGNSQLNSKYSCTPRVSNPTPSEATDQRFEAPFCTEGVSQHLSTVPQQNCFVVHSQKS